ncbi:25256_t:CDS:1, partial [Gigaspora margarita]
DTYLNNKEIGGSDLTKPIYYSHNDKDIEKFLKNYEAYSVSKDWNNNKK